MISQAFSTASILTGYLDSQFPSIRKLGPYFLDQPNGVEPHCVGNPKELYDIHASLNRFDLRYDGLLPPKTVCKVLLAQARRLPLLNQLSHDVRVRTIVERLHLTLLAGSAHGQTG